MKRCSPGTLDITIQAALDSDTDDCILWPHGTTRGTYGSYRQGRAHVAVCTAAHGDRPGGMEAAHTCGVSLCINPRHLRWTSPRGNQSDRRRHGTHLKGEAVPTSRLTATEVRAIRQRAATGEAHTQIAQQYGVTPSNIDHIIAGRTWKETL